MSNISELEFFRPFSFEVAGLVFDCCPNIPVDIIVTIVMFSHGVRNEMYQSDIYKAMFKYLQYEKKVVL